MKSVELAYANDSHARHTPGSQQPQKVSQVRIRLRAKRQITMTFDREVDPIETAMESALQPSRFISRDQEGAFVAGVEAVELDIAALADSDPARSVQLYEA